MDCTQGEPGDPTQHLVIGRRHDLARLFRVIATGARAGMPTRGRLTLLAVATTSTAATPREWERTYCAVLCTYCTVYTHGNCKLFKLTAERRADGRREVGSRSDRGVLMGDRQCDLWLCMASKLWLCVLLRILSLGVGWFQLPC
jgi:hypothetical protein